MLPRDYHTDLGDILAGHWAFLGALSIVGLVIAAMTLGGLMGAALYVAGVITGLILSP